MITTAIIALTVITSLLAFNSEQLLVRMIFNPYVIQNRKQYYRFLTSGLIHGDFFHLAFNMISFYFFGSAVEIYFQYIFHDWGGIFYILLYVSGMIMSQTFSYYKHRHDPRYNALGASGAVSAVIFCSILLNPNNGINIIPFNLIFEHGMPGYIFGPLYLLYTWYMSKRGMDNIGHDAHFFGALWGILFIIVTWHQALPHFFEQIFR